MERTLAIIKPDGVESKVVGKILARIEDEGFGIVAMRLLRLSRRQAEGFYAVHRQRPFFADLTAFISSGPVVVLVLERRNAIA
ncbi:MAG TPA: nucleoside-diphosphate kinase, partial [Candidatus Polarisedimenticolaceae bacterium]|nr:nucleoside-diphosphate kinase [Candidatus Polarisedimenticolaceae bacterium]